MTLKLNPEEDTCFLCKTTFTPAEPGQALCPACIEAEQQEWEAWREDCLAHVESLAISNGFYGKDGRQIENVLF